MILENEPQKKPRVEAFNIRASFLQLQGMLENYLETHSNISLNGLAKRCQVSEPTLRRIRKGQTKTLPSVTTIVELLMYLTKENDAEKLLQIVDGPLAKYLKDKLQQIEVLNKDLVISEELTQKLKDPIKYLIYKLASNASGVEKEKVVELFGSYGEKQLIQLQQEKLITEIGSRFSAVITNFGLSNDVFIEHFKTTADFIKPHKHASAQKAYSPIFSNYSSSVNKKGYSEIVKAQRIANRKIAAILSSDQYQGNIPTFAINAIDTLDSLCADEFSDDSI